MEMWFDNKAQWAATMNLFADPGVRIPTIPRRDTDMITRSVPI
jgi:hypothetical protein